MISFKQHISISKELSVSDDGKLLIEENNLLERLKLLKDIEQVYPLKNSKSITPHIKNNFKVHKSVRELVLGQFIMVEQILTGKSKFPNEQEMELAILQLLLRPKNHKEFDNEDHFVEQKNREEILESPVQDVYNVLHRYLEDRENVLFKEFSGVFYERDEDGNEEVKKDESQEIEEQDVAADFSQQWYWYSIVRMLAKEDIRVYPEIYMLKMDVVLPEMSYLAQKNKVESAQRRQQAALSKL